MERFNFDEWIGGNMYFAEWMGNNHYRLCNVDKQGVHYWISESDKDGVQTTQKLSSKFKKEIDSFKN